ncbi:Serine hydrolase FSH [Trinorchestia longiramus]|nr:Serine hydrolase FSH [Trinorchestia longiramus]
MSTAGRKLRILCLHGYRMDVASFRMKTGGLRKKLKSVAEFDFLEGGVEVVAGDESGIPGEEGRAAGRGWWFSREDDFFRATHYSDVQRGFQESVALVENQLLVGGPYDGVLAFSQGAALAAVLCFLMQTGGLKQQVHFRFVILFSGFKSRCSLHAKYYDELILTPSLHVFGSSDEIVDQSMSEELASCFSDATTLVHNGGHFVPFTTDVTSACVSFVKKFVDEQKETSSKTADSVLKNDF